MESTGTEAKWTAPDDVESVKVTVHISDGIGKSIKRVKTIKNKEFITPEPIVPPDVIDVAPDPPLNMIVPGKGAYGIKLGDPFKKVEALHGEPDGPIGVDQIFTYWENPDKGLAGHINGIGNVEDIFLSRPNKAKTADGNGIGSALDSVVREFGNADEIDNDVFGGLRHWYFKEGIEFTIDEEEKVQFIFLYSPFEEIPDDIGIQEAENAEAPKNAAMRLQRLRTQLKSTSEN